MFFDICHFISLQGGQHICQFRTEQTWSSIFMSKGTWHFHFNSFYQWNINWFNSKTKGKFNSKTKKLASSVSFEGQDFTCGPVMRKYHTLIVKEKEEIFEHHLQIFSGRKSVSQLTRWIFPYSLFPNFCSLTQLSHDNCGVENTLLLLFP